MGGGDRQCSEAPHISTTLAFSAASWAKLVGACLVVRGC